MSQNGPISRSFKADSQLCLTGMIGKWGRFGAFAADSFLTRPALDYHCGRALPAAVNIYIFRLIAVNNT